MIRLVFISSFLLLLISCGKAPLYEKSYSFQQSTWNQKEKPYFKVHIKDTSKLYNFTLSLRVSTDYEFNNIWFYLNSTTPSGLKGREPFEMKITAPDGTWIGKKTGTIVETQIYFKSRKLPEAGDYIFTLEQGVTQKELKNVLDVVFSIDEAP